MAYRKNITPEYYGVSATNTPWGYAQDSRVIAEGIVRVSTASHGGFVLSEPRMAELNVEFFGFQSFAGYGYFEEDQDWSIVALAFPDLFSEEDIYRAVNTARSSATPWESMPDVHLRWLPVVARLDEPDNKVQAIADRFRLEREDCWQVGSMSTSGKGWSVSLRRLKDGARQTVVFADYPGQGFYNDADLSVLNLAAEVTA